MKRKPSIQVNIRLAPETEEQLVEQAQGNFRSLTAEIERRLSQSLQAEQKEKAPNA